jgi:hypothetical protein
MLSRGAIFYSTNQYFSSAQIELTNNLNARGKATSQKIISRMVGLGTVPPFLPVNDTSRGLIYGAQTLLGYALMIAAMSVVLSYEAYGRLMYVLGRSMQGFCYRLLLDWALGKCFTADILVGAMNTEILAIYDSLLVWLISGYQCRRFQWERPGLTGTKSFSFVCT